MYPQPSHGRGHRFDPCIAHHVLRTFPNPLTHQRAEQRANMRDLLGEIWGNLFSDCSPLPSPRRAGRG